MRRSVDLRPDVEAAVREYQSLLMRAERRSVSFNEALNLLIEGFLKEES